MDVSTAAFAHCLVDIGRKPVEPEERAPIFNKGKTFVRDHQFGVSRVLNYLSQANSRDSTPAYTQSTLLVNS